MSTTWGSDQPPPERRLTLAGMLRVMLRGAVLAFLVFGGLLVLLLLRLVERPIFGLHRPITLTMTTGWLSDISRLSQRRGRRMLTTPSVTATAVA